MAVIINILQRLNYISDKVKLVDLDIKCPRNKNDNLQTKAQSYSTIISTKTIAPEDALEMADMTTDVTEVITRGETYWNKKEENQQQNLINNQVNNNNNDNDNNNNQEKNSEQNNLVSNEPNKGS